MANERKLVTVSIPTKDRPIALGGALSAIGQQTYRPLEVIIWDEGDIPAVENPYIARCLAYLELKEIKVKYLRNKNRQGICYARREILREAKGVYMWGNDDDMISDANAIELAVESIEKTGAGFIQAPFLDVDNVRGELDWTAELKTEVDKYRPKFWFRFSCTELVPIYELATGNSLIDIEKARNLGAFNWPQFLRKGVSGEDTLLGVLLADRYKGFLDPRIKTWHLPERSKVEWIGQGFELVREVAKSKGVSPAGMEMMTRLE